MNPDQDGHGLPDSMPERATLYLTTQLQQTETALRAALQQAELVAKEPFPSVLMAVTSAADLYRLSTACRELLDATQLNNTRCRLSPANDSPSLSELMQTQNLGRVISWIDGQWLTELLQDSRLVTHFQPIVRSCNPEKVFAYECLLRAIKGNGKLISPDRLYSAARATGLLTSLDRAARRCARAPAERVRSRRQRADRRLRRRRAAGAAAGVLPYLPGV